MARYAKFFSLGGGGGPNNLQLPVGTILDATLRQVQDGLGTGSPLYLSTGGLRVGTTAGSAMYWDNTNSRLGIGTSSPASTLDVVGNVRILNNGGLTFYNGASIFSSHYITTGNEILTATSYNTFGAWKFVNYNVSIGNNLAIGTILTDFVNPSQRLLVRGSGSTSATTSLLVQNSGGTNLFEVQDDGTTIVRRYTKFLSYGLQINDISGGVGGISLTGTPPANNQIIGAARLSITTSTSFSSTTGAAMQFSTSELSSTSGDVANFEFGGQANMQSGNASFSQLKLIPNFTTGGTYSGIVRGIYYNPSLTSVTGITSHRAIQTVTGDVLLATTSGQVGIGTTTPVGILHLYKSAAATRLAIDGDAGQNRLISYRTGAVQRFGLYVNNTAESGSNAGSNFAIRAYNDAGTLLSTPFFINRATGNVGVNTLTGTAKLQVVGSGTTSATSSLIVANNAGTTALEVLDDSRVKLGNSSDFTVYSGVGVVARFAMNIGSTSLPTAQLQVKGSGSTSATTSLLVQNSLGNNLLQISDAGLAEFGTIGGGGGAGVNAGVFRSAYFNSFGDAYTIFQTSNANGNAFFYNNVSIGSGVTPVASAALDVVSTTKGFLPPRMTTAEKNLIATPATGLMVFDTNLARPCFFNGATWITL